MSLHSKYTIAFLSRYPEYDPATGDRYVTYSVYRLFDAHAWLAKREETLTA
jgi:hypothetical protein